MNIIKISRPSLFFTPSDEGNGGHTLCIGKTGVGKSAFLSAFMANIAKHQNGLNRVAEQGMGMDSLGMQLWQSMLERVGFCLRSGRPSLCAKATPAQR